MAAPRGEIADRVLFENDRVRIWELRLPPGRDGDRHRHELDHVLIQIDGDRMAVVPEPDTQSPYREYLEAEVVPGQIFYVPKGGHETARNVGAKLYHEIIVELKEP